MGTGKLEKKMHLLRIYINSQPVHFFQLFGVPKMHFCLPPVDRQGAAPLETGLHRLPKEFVPVLCLLCS